LQFPASTPANNLQSMSETIISQNGDVAAQKNLRDSNE
jgi:hypothetical protein